MILYLEENLDYQEVEKLQQFLTWMGLRTLYQDVQGGPALVVVEKGQEELNPKGFRELPGVKSIQVPEKPFLRVNREVKKERTTIVLGDVVIGGKKPVLIAGPCSVESEEMVFTIAKLLKELHIPILRGGAFKPRTSPYAFQGLGKRGLAYLQEAAKTYGLLTISEVLSVDQVDLVASYVDILQIGARNMQNFPLLRAVGKTEKPVMLKRGLSATYEDWLMAAEYIFHAGNHRVFLCERGIRTFETYTRNTLDLASVPVMKTLSHLPIIVDPSHGTGRRDFVLPMGLAAIAAGADGLMVEVHPHPELALSDGPQSLTPEGLRELVSAIQRLNYQTKRG